MGLMGGGVRAVPRMGRSVGSDCPAAGAGQGTPARHAAPGTNPDGTGSWVEFLKNGFPLPAESPVGFAEMLGIPPEEDGCRSLGVMEVSKRQRAPSLRVRVPMRRGVPHSLPISCWGRSTGEVGLLQSISSTETLLRGESCKIRSYGAVGQRSPNLLRANERRSAGLPSAPCRYEVKQQVTTDRKILPENGQVEAHLPPSRQQAMPDSGATTLMI